MNFEEDRETIRRFKLPITHYIYCPRSHAQWLDLGGVYGALALGEMSPSQRREVISEYMKEDRQVRPCVNGPHDDIQKIYKAMQEGRKP